MELRDSFFVGGRWARPAGTGTLEVISPTTEEIVGSVPAATTADVDAAVTTARAAFDEGPWPQMPVTERAEHLRALVKHLETRMERAVEIQIDEMGGPRRFLVPTTGAMGPSLERIIGDATSVPLTEVREGTVGKVVVMREPVGVAAGVVPWNAPVMVAASKIFPSLLMGCPMILKPAAESPLSAYLIAEAAIEAELPAGVLSVIPGGGEVGQHLVAHRGVDKVTFTGSTVVGEAIARTCGEQLKHVTLELGGKSVAVVLEGVDLDRYLPVLVGGALRNSGQICVSTNRVLVPRAHQGNIVERLVGFVGAMKVGDPHDDDTDFGPLVSARQRDRVEEYLRSGVDQGARLVLGGSRPAHLSRGWFVEPTIFADVDNAARIAQEEIFGPVLTVIPYDTVDDAVAIANDSQYGLGGVVFAPDTERGLEVASRLRTGTCAVND
ncbi:MAG: aldehyde dehydrogenase family protein, partial [Acidimicrobiia bacterium]